MLRLFPDTAGSRRRSAFARRHRRGRARRARTEARSSSTTRRRCAPAPAPTVQAAPDATIVYGTKAFPNLAVMRILAEEGIGADVSTLGELRFAEAAGLGGERLVVPREQQVRRGARGGRRGRCARRRSTRSRRSTVPAPPASTRTLIRVTPGIEADTHESIRTGHHGSKFGLTPNDSLEALRRAPETEGLHVHIGSRAPRPRCGANDRRLDRRVRRARPRRARLGAANARPRRRPRRRRRPRTSASSRSRSSPATSSPSSTAPAPRSASPAPHLILEPGRSLTARAGVTLYTVGSVKTAADDTAYVAVDGGMSDNPRPALYGARYTAAPRRPRRRGARTQPTRSSASTASRATS